MDRVCAISAEQEAEQAVFSAGVFLVDKPVGPSSFRMVQLIRRALKIKKVGHSGTLDPFASGLLIICAGRPATRIIPRLMDGSKEYEAVLCLGVETDTLDTEGTVVATSDVPKLEQQQVRACLDGFQGESLQAPPAYSAVKHKGKPLYHYARKGIVIEKPPRTVFIHRIDLLDLGVDEMRILVSCSKGTYIRTLAADIGRSLGCGAHLKGLRRTKNGPFAVDQAIDGERLKDSSLARPLLLNNCLSIDQALIQLD